MIGWFVGFQPLLFEEASGFDFLPLVAQILRDSISAACLSSDEDADFVLKLGKRGGCLMATHRPI